MLARMSLAVDEAVSTYRRAYEEDGTHAWEERCIYDSWLWGRVDDYGGVLLSRICNLAITVDRK